MDNTTNFINFNSEINLTSPDYIAHYHIVKYSVFPTALASFISVFFVLFMYLTKKKLRNIAFKMVVYLQIADGIMAFSFILEIFDPIENNALCQTQAFLMNFGCVSSFLWTCCISSSIYFSCTGRWRRVELYEGHFLLISFLFPILLSIM